MAKAAAGGGCHGCDRVWQELSGRAAGPTTGLQVLRGGRSAPHQQHKYAAAAAAPPATLTPAIAEPA